MTNVAERNLLIALEVLQKKLIDERGLRDALQAWADDRSRSLLDVLQENGRLSPERRQRVEQAVELHPGSEPATATVAYSTPAAEPGFRFEKVAVHASGGLGIVHLGHDSQLHRRVAIKEIKAGWADHPHSRSRFRREALLTARLEHPGVIAVHGYWEDAAGRPAYAMQFVNGQSLREAIDEFHRDPGEETERLGALHRLLRCFVDVCHTLAYAHAQGVIHRDIKPGNILLGPFGQTLVADWGLAKVFDQALFGPVPLPDEPEQWHTSGPHGTPRYCSPEQAAGQSDGLGPATDVYSLGATLFDLLTGAPPKPGEAEPDAPASAPAPLIAVCHKAMAIGPQDRYGSARALGDDVSRWMAGEPVSVWREPLVAEARRWLHRVTTELIAGPAALDLYGQVLGLLRTRQEDDAGRLELAAGHHHLGLILASAGRLEEAVSRLEESLRLWEAVLAIAPNRAEAKAGHYNTRYQLGLLWMRRGQQDQAISTFLRQPPGPTGADDPVSEQYARVMLLLLSANAELASGRVAEGMSHVREAVERAGPLCEAAPTPRNRQLLVNALKVLARMNAECDNLTEALPAQGAACRVLERLVAEDPGNASLRADLFVAAKELALFASRCAAPDTESLMERAIGLGRGLLAEGGDQPEVRRRLAALYLAWGQIRHPDASAVELFRQGEAVLTGDPLEDELRDALHRARSETVRELTAGDASTPSSESNS